MAAPVQELDVVEPGGDKAGQYTAKHNVCAWRQWVRKTKTNKSCSQFSKLKELCTQAKQDLAQARGDENNTTRYLHGDCNNRMCEKSWRYRVSPSGVTGRGSTSPIIL